MGKNLQKVIMLGAVWGIFEATVGYLLHLFGIRIGSFIWFPVAYFFVHKAYKYTGSFSYAMLTAFIASSLKLINLLFPGRIDMVINPAVSIIFEALAVVTVCKYVLNGRIEKTNPLTIALTGFIWRSLYICYIFSMPQAYFDISSFTTTESFLEFMFVKNVINIIIISATFYAARAFERQFDTVSAGLRKVLKPAALTKPAFAAVALALAITAQVFIG